MTYRRFFERELDWATTMVSTPVAGVAACLTSPAPGKTATRYWSHLSRIVLINWSHDMAQTWGYMALGLRTCRDQPKQRVWWLAVDLGSRASIQRAIGGSNHSVNVQAYPLMANASEKMFYSKHADQACVISLTLTIWTIACSSTMRVKAVTFCALTTTVLRPTGPMVRTGE